MKKIKSDMPGDVVEIGPDQKEKSENIFSKLFADLKEYIENKDKIVVSLYGGSGSGKSSFAVLLAQKKVSDVMLFQVTIIQEGFR